MAPAPTTIAFYRRPGNPAAARWERRIRAWLKTRFPSVRIVRHSADLVVALGGDGTILDAARSGVGTVVMGLNLGTVGFLATVRSEQSFLAGLRAVLDGRYHAQRRLMLDVTVNRRGREVIRTRALNEVYLQNPLGMVTLDVRIGGTRVQRIQGTGVLVATPTGSTGYNLSAHGPIVDPSLELFIISEILDHNVPTPSFIVPADRTVTITVASFRKRGMLRLGRTACDVILSADGHLAVPLKKGDRILVRRAPTVVATAQLERDYFYQSLHEKFSIA